MSLFLPVAAAAVVLIALIGGHKDAPPGPKPGPTPGPTPPGPPPEPIAQNTPGQKVGGDVQGDYGQAVGQHTNPTYDNPIPMPALQGGVGGNTERGGFDG